MILKDWREEAKRRAAIKALENVKDGQIIGLGTGSTVAYAIRELGRLVKEEGLDIIGVPTSHQARLLALECGIPIYTLDECGGIDLAIDGADEVDGNLNLIKGMGAALAMEKVVDSLAEKLVIVVDRSKLSSVIGEKKPVPVEVLPPAVSFVKRRIESFGGKPVLRMAKRKDGPVVTDNGNFILDAHFGPIRDPVDMERKLKLIPGVVECGIFVNMADVVYVGHEKGVLILKSE